MQSDPPDLGPRVREPFSVSAAGCGGYVTGVTSQPRPCYGPATWAGLVYGHSSTTLWWAFACERHVAHLYAPRCLLDRDRAELERRRAQQERALAGRTFQRTEPLATGAAAKRLLRRAIAYHDHHKGPLDTGGHPSARAP